MPGASVAWQLRVPSPGSPHQLPHPIPFPKGTLVPGCLPCALQGSMGLDQYHQLGTKKPQKATASTSAQPWGPEPTTARAGALGMPAPHRGTRALGQRHRVPR